MWPQFEMSGVKMHQVTSLKAVGLRTAVQLRELSRSPCVKCKDNCDYSKSRIKQFISDCLT